MTDKDLHLLAGAAIYSVGLAVTDHPFVCVLLIAAAKEVYDGISGRGHVELADFAATCLGGLIVGALAK